MNNSIRFDNKQTTDREMNDTCVLNLQFSGLFQHKEIHFPQEHHKESKMLLGYKEKNEL